MDMPVVVQQYAPPAALVSSQQGYSKRQVFYPQLGPEWVDNALQRLNEIQHLAENWDGYGSPAVPEPLIAKMAKLVRAIQDVELPPGMPAPAITPTPDGMQIEWNGPNGGVELILHPDGSAEFVLELGGKYEEGRLNPEDSFPVADLLWRAFSADLPTGSPPRQEVPDAA